MINLKVILFIVLYCLNISIVAGPWTGGQENSTLNFDFEYTNYSKMNDDKADSSSIAGSNVNAFQLALSYSYGLWDDLDFGLKAPLEYYTLSGEAKYDFFAAGDLNIFSQYLLLKEEDNELISLALFTSINQPLRSYNPGKLLTPSKPFLDFDFSLIIGKIFYLDDIEYFTDLESTYVLRTQGLSDALSFIYSFGLILEDWTYILHSQYFHTLDGIGYNSTAYKNELNSSGNRPLEKVQEIYFKSGIGIIYALNDVHAVSFKIFTTLYARNSPIGHHLSVGYSYGF